MTLYVLKYNNYFNRKVLKEDSLSSYLTTPYYNGLHIDNVSFNPNDDIKTTQVFNFEPIGDYVICTIKTVNEGVATETIQSRWFILESKRERTGQYTVTLKRDVLADSYDTVVSSPMYIEKGMVKDSDPYIFNKERIPLNQIKQSETLLKDNTNCAWVVGYIPRNAFSTSTVITADVGLETTGADIYVNSLSSWDFFKYSNLATNPLQYIYIGDDIDNLILNLYVIRNKDTGGAPLTKVKISSKKSGGVPTGWGDVSSYFTGVSNLRDMTYKPEEPGYDYTEGYYRYIGSDYDPPSNYRDVLNKMKDTFTSQFYSSAKLLEAQEHYDVTQLNNKIIYDRSTSLAYKIVIEKHLVPVSLSSDVAVNHLIALGNWTRYWLCWPTQWGENSDETFKFDGEHTGYYTITLTQIGSTVHTTIDSSRAHLTEAPYDMFFMPYDSNISLVVGSTTVHMSPSMSTSVAVAVGAALGSQNLYDIQLLPYCPLNLNVVNNQIDVAQIPFKNNILDSGGNVVGVLMWSSVNSFRKEIEVPISVEDIKITQQTDLYRFCSPNYANAFDFNVAMNGGLEKVYADCTYKPYEPYIHVYPSFSNLYGNDFSDNRGLVCGGDFSLPQVTSEWVGYQLNHKNMNSVFSSDIISLNQEKLSKYSINEEIKNELGNIIAQPNGITRTSAVTYNNKLFPFIEYYTCTEKEKSALENKITYEGMTIGRIDTINNLLTDVYGDCFVKGRVIRLNINDKDTHYLDEIYKELMKGVYIHKEEESNE